MKLYLGFSDDICGRNVVVVVIVCYFVVDHVPSTAGSYRFRLSTNPFPVIRTKNLPLSVSLSFLPRSRFP